jgi:hypothetical protein
VFAGGPELYRGDIQATCPPNLEECVMAMEDCCEEVMFIHFRSDSQFNPVFYRLMMQRFFCVMEPAIFRG